MPKLNEQGKFINFPGVTLIAKIREADMNFWQEIHAALDAIPELKNNYALLPVDSYHMTVNYLYTKHQIGEDKWINFLTGQMQNLRNLNASLSDVTSDFVIGFKRIIVTNVIQIEVELSQQDNDTVCQIAKNHTISKSTPKNFHITLAYKIPGKNINFAAIQEQLNQIVAGLFITEIQLASPRLCYFNDMTKFTEWDAKQYPFLDYAKSYFFSTDKFKAPETAPNGQLTVNAKTS